MTGASAKFQCTECRYSWKSISCPTMRPLWVVFAMQWKGIGKRLAGCFE